MGAKYKITIPEPCHEDWDKMTPDETGRFCNSCSKSVVDFSKKTPTEIQEFFIKNQGQKICGRFKNSQLDSIVIKIPNHVLLSQVHYHKMFLLALFICMGTTLFSCKQEDGSKKKIDLIEVIADSLKLNPQQTHLVLKDSLENKSLPPEKVKNELHHNLTMEDVSSEDVSNGYDYHSEGFTVGGAGLNEPIILSTAAYPGGLQKLYDKIQNDSLLSKKAKKSTGKLQVFFQINTDGTLDNIKVLSDIGNETGNEIIRILKTSPKWMPSNENGKEIVSYLKLLIDIQKDSINPKRRKRKFSKITAIDVLHVTDQREIKQLKEEESLNDSSKRVY